MLAGTFEGYRLSPSQERVWRLSRGARPGLYRLGAEATIIGAMTPERLEEGLLELVARHEILRTSLKTVPGLAKPVQVIADSATPSLAVEDLTGLAGEERAARVEALRRGLDEDAPDLEGDSPLRVVALRLAAEEYRVSLTAPVTILDEEAARLLLAEWMQICSGADEDPTAEALQYADVAEWQHELLEEPADPEIVGFWRHHGEKDLLTVDLPLVESPGERPYEPRTVSIDLPSGLGQAALRRGREGDQPVDARFLAAWAVVLARWTDVEEIGIGVWDSGRHHEELRGALGPLARFLPLRIAAVRSEPFSRVVEAVSRDLPNAVLWQDYFAWPSTAGRDRPPDLPFYAHFGFRWHRECVLPEAPGIELSLDRCECLQERSLLTLLVTQPEAGGARLGLRYDAAVIDGEVAEQVLRQVEACLADAVELPERRVGSLSLVSEEDLRTLQRELGEPSAGGRFEAVHRPIATAARARPQDEALRFGEETVSYAELVERAERLASHLRALGVGSEDRVGIFLERSPSMVIAVVAVLASGGAFVPLDPSHPDERLRWVLRDAEIGHVVSARHQGPRLADSSVELIYVEDEAAWQVGPPRDPSSEIDPRTLAYVIYTSGSTGAPKGVMVHHGGLFNYLEWCVEAYEVAQGPGSVLHSSLGFDLTITGLLAPLRCGRAVRLVPPHDEADALVEELEADRPIGLLKLTPAHLKLLSTLLPEDRPGAPVGALVVGGDALYGEDLRFWRRRLPTTRIFNEYGPTEVVVGCCVHEVPSAEPSSGSVPIGRPITDTRLYVLDSELRPLPPGHRGELFVAGRGVTRGYLGQPSLTAAAYLPDLFARQPGERMYRTGDRVRYRTGLGLVFEGRADRQVKIRGHRIELREVEQAILAASKVAEVVVRASLDPTGEKSLAAYVVPVAGAAPLDLRSLRQRLRASLPEAMVPAAMVELDRLPLTRNGKVDLEALPPPEMQEDRSGSTDFTPTEEILAGFWSEVLGVERVIPADDFFALGGHSLQATRVIARVHRTFGKELSMRSLFGASKLADFASLVESAGASPGPTLPPITPLPPSVQPPLSFAQQRLWFLEQLDPGKPTYNLPIPLDLEGHLDLPALEWSLEQIVRRHEALRTTFDAIDGRAIQRVGAPPPVDLPVVDLTGLPEADRDALGERLLATDAARGFDLRRGPLFRALVLRRGAQRHALLFTLHHLVADGWSLGLLVEEWVAHYRSRLQGRNADLPDLPARYRDYAAWQRDWLRGETLETLLEFWRGELDGLSPTLPLPVDRPAPPARSGAGGGLWLELPRGVAAAARGLARREGVTLFMLLLAAFRVLLARYCGQEDFSVGTPVAGRDAVETEGLIGLFINTLVLRTSLAGDPTFGELLARERESSLRAFAHQQLPFEALVESLNPERSRNHSPLFQVLFVLQNAPNRELELPGLELRSLPLAGTTAKFDLSLSVDEDGDRLLAYLEFSSELFDRTTAQRLVEAWSRLLEDGSAHPEKRIGELRLLSAAQRQQVFREWGETGAVPSAELCLHHLLSRQGEATPQRVAVQQGAEHLTYGGLMARSLALASSLRAAGVRSGVAVGLLLERSLDWAVAAVGVLAAGGRYIPLDPTLPTPRIERMVADAAPRLVLVGAGAEGQEPSLSCPRVELREVLTGEASLPGSIDSRDGDPGDPAYTLYTSGSTGGPKGVTVPHRAIVNRVLWVSETLGLSPDARLLQKTSLGFDASLWEFWAPWAVGARVVLARVGSESSPQEMARQIAEQGITDLQLVPSLLQVMVEEGVFRECPSLQRMYCGGEMLPTALAARFVEQTSGQVINTYGLTETAVDCTAQTYRPGEGRRGGRMPIGRPLPGLQVWASTPMLHDVVIGGVGEIQVAGCGLASHYSGRPALTAERFRPHPVPRAPGERLFRTGDLGRIRADGRLSFVGRLDRQVKLRGLRIELAEIESTLEEHPAVKEAVVVVRPTASDEQLVGYFVPHAASATHEAELRRNLADKLPAYMVPSVLVPLGELPRTDSGKLDRNALPAVDLAPPRTGRRLSSDAAHHLVTEILAGVLGLEAVADGESFFALGGHSLLATRLLSRIREAFEVEIGLAEFFDAPTVGGLVASIQRRRKGPDGPSLPPLRRRSISGPAPLSFGQQRLWFLSRLDEGSAAYNIPALVELSGELRHRPLSLALDEVVRRHEALRTVFVLEGAEPAQLILPAKGRALPTVDLGALPASRRAAVAEDLGRREAARPFDLGTDLPWRALLIRAGRDRHLLSLTLHHIVADAWSMEILVEEMAALYAAFAAGQPSPLPPLELQYADFATWQRSWLRGEELSRLLSYWKKRLEGAPPAIELATDRPRPDLLSTAGGVRSKVLSETVVGPLRSLVRQRQITLYMTFLAVFQELLRRYSGQRDLTIGTPVAGRGRLEIEPLIGFFINTLVLRFALSGEPTGIDLCERTRGVVLEAEAHQAMPFEKLVEELQPVRSLNRSPLFQVSFAANARGGPAVDLQGLELAAVETWIEDAKFDLTLTVDEQEEGWRASLEYLEQLYDETTIDRMLGHFGELAAQLGKRPTAPVSTLPILAPAEIDELLRNPTEPCLSEEELGWLLTEQADRGAGQVVLGAEDPELTYRELAKELAAEADGEQPRGWLLDESLSPVAPGVVGELFVEAGAMPERRFGPGMGAAPAFVPAPWDGEPGARLYRSGLWARRSATGLRIWRRPSQEPEADGFDPTRVERALLEVAGLDAALVLAAPEGQSQPDEASGADGSGRRVAYVIPAPGRRLVPQALRVHLRQTLGAAEIPQVIVILESGGDWPRDPSGFLDHGALPPAVEAPPEEAEASRREPTETEAVILSIWEEVLGRENLALGQDFFAAGGHSLSAAAVAARIEERFGLGLSLRELFAHTTVASLGARLEELLIDEADEEQLDELLELLEGESDPEGES